MQHPELLVVTDELRSIDGTLFDPLTGPVTDWATDFDHTDPGWAGDPYPIWDDLRQRCPVAHSDRYGGVWLPTRYEDVAEIAQDPGLFSSRAVIVSNRKPPPGLAPIGAIPPISSDPPYHQGARKLLQPAFSPGSVGAYEESTQAFCHELIDGFGDRSVIDAATEYAQHIPMRVIGDMLGLPRTDGQAFARFVHNALEGVNSPIEDRIAGFEELFAYLRTQVEDHLAHPRPDLTSFLIETHTDDGRTDLLRVAGSIALLLIAGIDTTWSAIGASLWHLAGHPDDRRRLVDDPALVIPATEELLRVYAPVTMARLVTRDVDWHGCPMRADDWILLSFPAANRDPEVFDRPDDVVLDRPNNRHAAFGIGAHRCLGAHLARMELRVALGTWLSRIPDFSLNDPDAVRWSGGQIRGPRTLPITRG
jgi:cytochrome P450